MQTYELLVSGRSVRSASVDTTLVRTSIGIDQVHVLFDNAEWLDFPITATFAMGDVVRTAQLIVSEIAGSEWVAESTVTIPYEVIRKVGRIRVTFQGTDSQGRHIITAYGTPLSVVEAGDVEIGEIPEDAPTVDEWQQMRADAQRAINDAQSLVSNLQSQLDAIVSAAEGSLDGAIRDATDALEAIVESTRPIASDEVLGMVRVGDGLNVTDEGVLSSYGLTDAQRTALANLIDLATKVTDADVTTTVPSSPRIDPDALPVATPLTLGTVMPDGTTIRADDDGMIHAYAAKVDVATTSQAGSVKPDGTSITIDPDGTIHGSDQVPIATTSVAGKVKPDGTTITVDGNGTISGATATSSAKGMMSVPSGNGLYVSNGALYANTASTSRYGMVRLAEDGGLVSSSSRLMVRDATNVMSGKVLPDAETIGVVDGRLSVLSSSTEVRRVTPFSFEGMDYAAIRLAEDGIACFVGGAILFTYDYDYGTYGSGTGSSGISLSQMLAREGDLADELRINPNSSVTVVRNTAAIWLRGVAPYDSTAGFNLTEYQRYWSQLGVSKTQADLDAFVIGKAAELSGDPSISDMEAANAYFREHPYMEVRPLREPVLYQSGTAIGGPPNSTFLFTEIHEGGYSAGLWDATFEWWWSRVECVPGFPEATESSKGVVMPDNETITVRDGVLTAVGTHGGPYLDVREDTDGNRRIAIVIPEEE